MELLTDQPTDEVINKAVTFMVGERGTNIVQITDHTVTFEAPMEQTLTSGALGVLSAFSPRDVPAAVLNQTQMLMRVQATLAVTDGRVLLGGYGWPAEVLKAWLTEEFGMRATVPPQEVGGIVFEDRSAVIGGERIAYSDIVKVAVGSGGIGRGKYVGITLTDGRYLEIAGLDKSSARRVQELLQSTYH
jgi:hypothetical protein